MSRNLAYSDEDDDRSSVGRYSDDFDSEDEMRSQALRASTPKQRSHRQHRQQMSRPHTPRKRPKLPYYQHKAQRHGRRLNQKKENPQGKRTKRGRGHGHSSEPADSRRGHDTVTLRVMSANRNRVNELRNKVEELKVYIRDLQLDNRLYKKTQFRQEKALRVFEDKENDLPSILDRHYNEVRSLKEHNRRLKEKYEKTDRYLRDAEDELERVKRTMKKYKDICERKELLEREELSQRLAKAERDLDEKEAKLEELQRHMELLKKNHKHELGIEVARQRELKKQMEELVEKNSQLDTEIKEKEKALDYHNIYSKPRQGRLSRDSSREGSLIRRSRKKSSAVVEPTSREKAKLFAEKQRSELLRQKELKDERERKKRQQWEKEQRQIEMEKKADAEHRQSLMDREAEERKEVERKEREDRQIRDRERQEEEEWQKKKEQQKKQEADEMMRQVKEDRERHDHEERERRQREEQRRREEMREKEERERREEERNWKEREKKEQERLERERKERQEREKEAELKIEEERREREKAEQERRLKEEKEKMNIAERKKKDDLLKKLKAIDDDAPSDPFTPTPSSKTSKEHSRTGETKNMQAGRSAPKEYSFTQPIKNLHQGKPSHEENSIPYLEQQRQKRQTSVDNGDDDGGYQPSFAAARSGLYKVYGPNDTSINNDNKQVSKPVNTTTKQNDVDLMKTLFGGDADKSTTKAKQTTDNFSFNTPLSNSPAKISAHRDWTDHPRNRNSALTTNSTSNSRLNSETKSAIFGGGTALFEDDLSSNRSKVLPRRQRTQNLNTFAAKPSVTAIDTFEDDIEEITWG